MTVHRLEIEPRDVAAEALGLLLDAPAPVPLAELTLDDQRGGLLLLGVLGASHAVTARCPGYLLTEQVSCDAVAAGGRPLPRTVTSGAYRMSSRTRAVSRSELEATAARLGAVACADDAWLCGTFPGASGALTALRGGALGVGGWRWETWHLYPGAGEGVIVTTRSRWTP